MLQNALDIDLENKLQKTACFIDSGKLVDRDNSWIIDLSECPLCYSSVPILPSAIPVNLRPIAQAFVCSSCGHFVMLEHALSGGKSFRSSIRDNDTLPAISAVIRQITERRKRQWRTGGQIPAVDPLPILTDYIAPNLEVPFEYMSISKILSLGLPTTAQRYMRLLDNLRLMSDTEGQCVQLYVKDYPLAFGRDADVLRF